MLSFIGIGAQKSGTTWVYEHLRKHPEIRFPGGKEMHFWNGSRPLSLDNYRHIFRNHSAALLGEITPAYSLLSPERIQLINKHFPSVRVFFIIRNPIFRAWSSALMACRRAEMEIDEASDQWFIDHFFSRGSRGRSDYLTTLRNWKSTFGSGRFFLGTYDQIASDPRSLLLSLCYFLSVDPGPVAQIPDAVLRRKIKPVPTADQQPRESLLAVLREIYYPEIRELQPAVPFDLDSWFV